MYNGSSDLKKLQESVVMIGSSRKPIKMTVSETKYAKVKSIIGEYAKRFAVVDSRIVAKEKPIMISEKILREKIGPITDAQLKKLAEENGDRGALIHYPATLDSETKKRILENSGLETGVTYVVLESCYPRLKIFQN